MLGTCDYCGKHGNWSIWWKSQKWGHICTACYFIVSKEPKVYSCIYCTVKTTLPGKVCQRCRIKQSEGITLKKKKSRRKVKKMSDPRWIEKWFVIGTSGKKYTVARDAAGKFGCTCPAWKFQKGSNRRDCSHILLKKFELIKKGGGNIEIPTGSVSESVTPQVIRGIKFDD
jgi:hypothetical protein